MFVRIRVYIHNFHFQPSKRSFSIKVLKICSFTDDQIHKMQRKCTNIHIWKKKLCFYQKMLTLAVIFLCSSATASPHREVITNNSEINQALINGIDNFTNQLIHTLYARATPNSNVLLSPINIYNVLSILSLGSAGKTYDELAAVLGFSKTAEKFLLQHKSLGDLIKSLELTKYEQPSECADISLGNVSVNCTYEDVTFANAVFLQRDYSLLPTYVENLKAYSRGTAENVDFENDAIGTTEKINKWVAEKTRNLIPKLYQSPTQSNVRIMLTSTVYFSAYWSSGLFKTFRSPEDNFFTEGDVVKVEYMFNELEVNYYEEEPLYRAIQLPYRDADYETIFILPNANSSISSFVKSFTVYDLKKIMKKFKLVEVAYQIPYLDMEWTSDLVEPLKSMNLNEIFNNADLSNMILNKSIRPDVSKVSHATRLKMDEQGTVASGGTSIDIEFRLRGDRPPIEFVANRPYLFFIYHKVSTVIAFSALIRNPKLKL